MRSGPVFKTILLALIFAAIHGCGKEEDPGALSAAATSATQSAPVLQSATTPIAAATKAPVPSNPLSGIWIGITDGDFVGFELTNDGKATLRSVLGRFDGVAGPLSATYSFLDGRLSFVSALGRAMSFDATLAGEQLELKGAFELSPTGIQRFQRAQTGQTFTQAAQEQARARAQEVQNRIDAVDRFLGQPGMVLVIATNPPRRIALDLVKPSGNAFSGKGWHDDTPPHSDAITGQLVQGDSSPEAMLIRLQLGEQIQPQSTAKTGGSELTLDVITQGNNIQAAGKLVRDNTPVDVSIKQDLAAHNEIRGRFELTTSRIAAERGRQVEDRQSILRSLGGGGAPLVGIMRVSLIGVTRMPISLMLSHAPDGSFTGAAKFPILQASATFQARLTESSISGTYLELQFKDFKNGTPASTALAAQLRKQPWRIAVSEVEGAYHFGPVGDAAAAELFVASDAWKSDQQKRLTDSLAAGVSFRVRYPERANVPETMIRLRIDPSSKAVAGAIAAGGAQIDAHAGATITGALKEQDGLLFIPAQMVEPELPGRARTIYQTDMLVFHEPTGWTIISPMFPPNQPRARKTLEMTEVKE